MTLQIGDALGFVVTDHAEIVETFGAAIQESVDAFLPRREAPLRGSAARAAVRVLNHLVCRNCGADMRIIVFVTEAAPVQPILAPIGEPTEPPPIGPARGPPAWDADLGPTPHWDLIAQPDPAFELHQPVSWSPPSAAAEGAAAPDLTPARCACTLLPNPGRCALRHLRDVRAAFD